MNDLINLGIAFAWIAILGGSWVGWQLLRQNGRLLLRVEELEQRLDELEFGKPSDDALGESEGRARHSVRAERESNESGAQGTDAPYPEDRASRFNNHSLARSRIKRDGLKAGTAAPDFRLPRLDGRGELALEELRGRRVLLVFSDPHCGPCNILAPELEKFHRSQNQAIRNGQSWRSASKPLSPSDGERVADRPGEGKVVVVMISKGEPKENRAKIKVHGLTLPVVLQQQWEISRRYAMFATPVAYLIDEAGIIVNDPAIGAEAILALTRTTSAVSESLLATR